MNRSSYEETNTSVTGSVSTPPPPPPQGKVGRYSPIMFRKQKTFGCLEHFVNLWVNG